MSLLILVALISVGIAFISVVRAYEHEYKENNISENAMSGFAGYTTALLFGSIGSIGVGVFYWLKNGAWLTVSPYYLLSYLEHDNPIRKILITDTSWAGIQQINNWYLDLNLGWSFLLTIVILFFIMAVTTK